MAPVARSADVADARIWDGEHDATTAELFVRVSRLGKHGRQDGKLDGTFVSDTVDLYTDRGQLSLTRPAALQHVGFLAWPRAPVDHIYRGYG